MKGHGRSTRSWRGRKIITENDTGFQVTPSYPVTCKVSHCPSAAVDSYIRKWNAKGCTCMI